jgi:hypothetical protein
LKLAKSMNRSSGIVPAIKKIDEAGLKARADCSPGSRCVQSRAPELTGKAPFASCIERL